MTTMLSCSQEEEDETFIRDILSIVEKNETISTMDDVLRFAFKEKRRREKMTIRERRLSENEATMIRSPVRNVKEIVEDVKQTSSPSTDGNLKESSRMISRRYARSLSEIQRMKRPEVKTNGARRIERIQPCMEPKFAFDIGGTLCKVVYFQPDKSPELRRSRSNSEYEADEDLRDFILSATTYGESGQRDVEFQFHSELGRGTFHFIKFETRLMSNAFKMFKDRDLHKGLSGVIYATGGGAVKYEPQFRKEFGAKIEKCDELEMLIRGINFLVDELPSECYYLKDNDYRSGPKIEKVPFTFGNGDIHPCIVVNIGSGVSMMLVDAAGHFRRVGGTSVGGGTFYGLVSTLTSCKGFKEAIDIANSGDNAEVDLLVRDIYGRDYVEHGLKADVVASSFGKLTRPEQRASAKPADVALSALVMISVNIASLAHLHAEAHGAKSIMFVGSFLHENPIALKTLSYYTQYASKDSRRALFLEHDGYFGAVGSLLCAIRSARSKMGDSASDLSADITIKRRANTSEI